MTQAASAGHLRAPDPWGIDPPPAGTVIDQHLHAVSPLRAEHEDRAAERVVTQHRLYQHRQAIRAAAEVDRAGRDQHPHPRRWRAGRGRDHRIAFNRRSTLARTASSAPALTRTMAPQISTSIAAVPAFVSGTTGTNSGSGVPVSTAATPNSRRQ